ncbi:MAG: LPD7 domain-containing protein [Aquabacterium sp.]
MANTISAGADEPLLTGRDPAARAPVPALTELTTEIQAADQLALNGKLLASRQRSSITSRTDLRIAAVNELTAADPARKGVATVVIDKETARQWATLDAAEFGRMRSQARKTMAMDAIAGNLRASPDYAEALHQAAPVLASGAQAIHAEVLKQEAAREVAEAESRRLQEVEAQRAARFAAIDASALASVARIREQQIAEVTARLRHDPDPLLGGGDIREAQQGLSASQNAALGRDSAAALADGTSAEIEKFRVIKRPILESELPQEIRARFIVSTQKSGVFGQASTEFLYRVGNRQGELVFSDAGKQLITTAEDRETIRAMLEVAQAKNWNEITVSGSDAFRRRAWLDARVAGMAVRGYQPRDADQMVLQQLRRPQGVQNRVIEGSPEHHPTQASPPEPAERQRGEHIDADALTAGERAGLKQAREILDSKGLSTEFSAAALAQVEKIARGERLYIGTVVDHGAAPYRFETGKDRSYYITLQTQGGEQTIWGKGLQQAVAGGSIKKGDEIVLRNAGQREVTVKEKVVDATGTVTGLRDKPARLNEWTAQPLARYIEQTRQAAASATPAHQPAAAPPPRTPREHDR